MNLLKQKYTLPAGKIDLTSFGEVLVDLITTGEDMALAKATLFQRYFGGAAANVAINMKKLDNKCALISRVGDDSLGQYLKNILVKEKINIEGLQCDPTRRTPLILVNKSKKTPSWLPYRGADRYIEDKEINYRLIKNSKIFFLTTFILSQKPSRTTALRALDYALQEDKIIAFDPCYRPQLWPEENNGYQLVKRIIGTADFIKPSLDDAHSFFGPDTPENYLQRYLKLGAKIVILTMGEAGVLAGDEKTTIRIPIYPTTAVDVTGAGDSFWAGFMTGILSGFTVERSIKLGSGTAAYKVKNIGALSPIPGKEEIISSFNI
ncbi:MAG: carbohydrate kinase family protein [Halanaerobiales bacterium]